MRTFYLRRNEDVSGVSGTGVVAEGIQFDDGYCTMRWLTKYRSTESADSIEILRAIHEHGGRTVVEWLDEVT